MGDDVCAVYVCANVGQGVTSDIEAGNEIEIAIGTVFANVTHELVRGLVSGEDLGLDRETGDAKEAAIGVAAEESAAAAGAGVGIRGTGGDEGRVSKICKRAVCSYDRVRWRRYQDE